MTDRNTTPRKNRRQSEEGSRRRHHASGDYEGKRPVSTYEAASKDHPLVPNVRDPSPSSTARAQRFMQILARHMYRNDPWIKNLVRVMGALFIGNGPIPVSRFPERDKLFLAASRDFDNRGIRNFGGWLREDVYRNFVIDGEAFIRRRVRDDYPIGDTLLVPLQFQALTAEYCPHDYTQQVRGMRFVNGIAKVYDRPTHYAMYNSHPLEPDGDKSIYLLPETEIMHVYDPMTGANRGEVLLASALLRAIKVSTLEDAELRRKHVSSLISGIVERPVDASDDEGMLPTEDEVMDMIDGVQLSGGGIIQMPYGYKFSTFAPKDEGPNFEKALRWQLLAICAGAGMPAHYVTQDWSSENVTERIARLVDQGVERSASIVHDSIERQALNPIHSAFVDKAMATGLWTPPDDLKPWELYDLEWEWEQMPNAAFSRELTAMLLAEEQGAIDMGTVTKKMFGKSLESVQRASARGAARGQALGLVRERELFLNATPLAARIAKIVEEEEALELDIVEGSYVEDSVADKDKV